MKFQRAGPDRTFDLGSPFHLEREVDETVIRFQPVFLRVGFLPWSIRTSVSCADAAKELKSDGINPAWLAAAPGETEIGEYDAYLPSPWERARSETGAINAKVLVTGSAFFRPGATYCLLLYQQKKLDRSERFQLRERFEDFLDDVRRTCTDADPTCKAKQLEDLFESLDDLQLSAALKKKVEAQIEGRNVDLALDLALHQNELKALATMPAVGRWEPGKVEPASKRLPKLIAQLLVWHGVLTRKDKDYLITGQTTKVLGLGITPKMDDILYERAGKDGGTETVKLGRDPSSLALPNSEVTLRDVLELARGSIPTGDGRYARISELPAGALKPAIGHDPAPALAALGKIEPRLEALKGELRQAWAAPARPTAPESGVRRALAVWIKGALVRCREIEGPLADLIQRREDCHDPKPGGWPGYGSGSRDGPLELLLRITKMLSTDFEGWSALTNEVVETAYELSWNLAAHADLAELQVRMDQDAWIDSYVTQFLGWAVLLGEEHAFGVPYGGFQFFFWPNEVDEPMWTNGPIDWRRSFALEVGVGVVNGPFGQRGRFSGHPILIGAVVHPIPYITGSLGVAILDRKDSTLDVEDPRTAPSFYVSVAAEINLAGLFYKLFTQPSTAVKAITKADDS